MRRPGRRSRSIGNRHTLVTEIAESGAGDEVIMSIAGHVSRATAPKGLPSSFAQHDAFASSRHTGTQNPTPKCRTVLMKHRNKTSDGIKTRAWSLPWDQRGRRPTCWPCGVRCREGVTQIRAFVRNSRTCLTMIREKAQAEEPRGGTYRCVKQGRTAS
jgi:hypothetical protein